MKSKYILSAAALLTASLAAAHAQTTLADWDFDGAVVSPPDNTPSASYSIVTSSATQLGMSNDYTYAGGEGPGSTANADVESLAGASTGADSYGWRVRGNSNSKNAGAGNANGWNSEAPIGSQGAEFSVDTTLYTSISLSFDVNESGQGERNLAIEYTLNDTVADPTWLNATITSAGSQGTLEDNTTSANTISGNYVELSSAGTGWNNQITAIFSGVSQDPNFAFEIVNASTGTDDVNASGAALNNSSGNWAFDNVLISGVQAVPEPGSLALIGFGLTGVLAFRKARQA